MLRLVAESENIPRRSVHMNRQLNDCTPGLEPDTLSQ
jgi:hypothetical protein